MGNPSQKNLPIKTAIIGLGHIGKFHIRAIQSFSDIDLIAVCDRNKSYQSISPPGVDFYSDFEDLLLLKDLDTIIIATPNHTHYYIARAVLDAGFNIILEKPAAETIQELEELEKVAKKYSLDIYYAFHSAFAFEVDWFAKYYQKNQIYKEYGPITGFICRFYDPYIESGNLKSSAVGLQDPWFDSGINALSVVQRFIDLGDLKIENVSAAINYAGKPRFLQSHNEYSFSIGNGFDFSGFGIIDVNWTSGRNHKSTILQFVHSGKSIRLCHSSQCVYLREKQSKDEILLKDCSEGEDRLYNHYIGVFRNYLSHKRKGEMNNVDALSAHRLLFDSEKMINQPL